MLNHSTIHVKRSAGNDFVVLSAEDWKREKETLHVLQSASLTKQIVESLKTHHAGTGYIPTKEEMNEINRI